MTRGTAASTEMRSRLIVSTRRGATRRALKVHLRRKDRRNPQAHRLPEYVTQRQRMQKAQRVNDTFRSAVSLRGLLDRTHAGQHVAMGVHDALGIPRGSRCKQNLQWRLSARDLPPARLSRGQRTWPNPQSDQCRIESIEVEPDFAIFPDPNFACSACQANPHPPPPTSASRPPQPAPQTPRSRIRPAEPPSPRAACIHRMLLPTLRHSRPTAARDRPCRCRDLQAVLRTGPPSSPVHRTSLPAGEHPGIARSRSPDHAFLGRPAT